jgi:hypothetical protein
MEQFENKPINYARFKENSSDSIVCQDGKYQISRKIITKGYDGLMYKWDVVKTESKLLPISEAGCFKEINQVIYVQRKAIDSMLKEISIWLKVVRKISVLDKENNIFLVSSNNRIFQTDLDVTAPLNLNYCPQGLRIEKLSETPLTKEELQKLNEDLSNPKVYIKPLIAEELQSGELRLLV